MERWRKGSIDGWSDSDEAASHLSPGFGWRGSRTMAAAATEGATICPKEMRPPAAIAAKGAGDRR
uniref:Uncharacterized protein n=1 Tax=Oryza sativa subsp. japonica TaxID=39947 RepID=Q6ZCX7_ORYSJ|nr:hypothetical protein [Oryza sativa Japonica Group]BAC99528.1 hypothetical protein [Oryza sativa Japonica Group]